MKNIYKYLVLIAAALSCSTALMAQMDPGTGADGIVFNKETVEISPNNYEITIDAFVTGKTTTTNEPVPCDIVLVLDVSTSMSASQYSNGSYFTLATPQELTTGDNIGILHTSKDSPNNYADSHDGRLRYQIKIGNETYNLLYYNKKWYYGKRTSWSTSTTNPWKEYTARSSNDIIYTDVKIDLLQKAVNDFIAKIQENATKNGVDHKIGVATFCGNLTQYCNIATATENSFTVHTGTSSKSQSMNAFVNDLHNHMGGNTDHSKGFKQAGELYLQLYGGNDLDAALKSKNAEGRSQVVVLFTDGDPNSSQQTVVTNTIEESYKFKKNNAKVYSVGVFTDTNIGNISNPRMKLSEFLDYVSSDYPDAKTYGTYGTHIEQEEGKLHKYYFKAEGADLSSIFTTIAEESSKADIELNESSTSTVDIISDNFTIPADTPDGNYDGTKYGTTQAGNAIGLYVAKVNGKSGDNYTFDTPVSAKTAKDGDGTAICPNINAKVDGDKLTITGFDYAKYCVGEVEGSNPKEYKGYKLVIKIKIEINPDNPGGASVPSNAPGSGIYHEGKQVAEFQMPTVRIPNIVIIKQGLKKGESATFTVEGTDEDGKALTPMTLVATCKDGKDAVARVKIQKPGRYTVTESTWSWAYSVSELVSSYTKDDSGTTTSATNRSITRNVNEATEDQEYSGTPFIFVNSAKSAIPDHGESYKPNVFAIQQ